MKLCKTCGLEKTGSHGSYCKSCNSERVVRWKQQNREKYNEYSRKLAKKLSQDGKKRSRSWEESNRERLLSYKATWRSNNLDKYREYDRKRRALKLNNGFEKYSEDQILSIYGTSCHICNKDIDLNAPRRVGADDGWEQGLHIDHLIPISMGGPDTLENVRPSHAICNLKKSSFML